MEDERYFVEKSENYTSDYSESFGYSTFGTASSRTSAINFFKMVPEWVEGSSDEVIMKRYVLATVKMNEDMALKLADYIYEQHKIANTENGENVDNGSPK